ncbi:MAG: hypothetical protein NC308_07465, partial [Clostridium sp.]|nr:hypothetical protein [Clostridium sp.]
NQLCIILCGSQCPEKRYVGNHADLQCIVNQLDATLSCAQRQKNTAAWHALLLQRVGSQLCIIICSSQCPEKRYVGNHADLQCNVNQLDTISLRAQRQKNLAVWHAMFL